jgi:hypothetical protein
MSPLLFSKISTVAVPRSMPISVPNITKPPGGISQTLLHGTLSSPYGHIIAYPAEILLKYLTFDIMKE